MSVNNQNVPPPGQAPPPPYRQHYRDHVYQQDGWTVLGQAPQPPPYMPAPPPVPVPVPVPPTSQGTGNNVLVPFEVPLHTNIVGGAKAVRTLHFGPATAFDAGFKTICDTMGLSVVVARLGYKWDDSLVRDPWHALANSSDWQECLTTAAGKIQRARTRVVMVKVHNLAAPTESAGFNNTSSSRKRKAIDDFTVPSLSSMTVGLTSEYRRLCEKLWCKKCQSHCFDTPDGRHIHVPDNLITLWAKALIIGKASLLRPPENIMFQHFFYAPDAPTAKRRRTENINPAPAAPAVHVHINSNPGFAPQFPLAQPQARTPLSSITHQVANTDNMMVDSRASLTPHIVIDSPTPPVASSSSVIDLTGMTPSSPVHYPSVFDILSDFDQRELFTDLLTFPAIIFALDLQSAYGIMDVAHVAVIDEAFFEEQLNMPHAMAQEFVERCIIAKRRAEKGKGRAFSE
ncbi:hypothetical protein GGX14DRAFT_395209 [Mycena pura]|uniref:Uncharacterized protein n=1 Tax=Mycena pura TaxID=153505 RepID=A0AAD6VKS2_9AGAR|nr:hypothetical protein GGX14DRAFT_395209 [Mycena pura]